MAITRRFIPAIIAVLGALSLLAAMALPAYADTVDSLTDAYKVRNFATARGTVQVAVDIPALLRDGTDADATDDGDEVVAYTGATRVQGLSSGILRVQIDTAYLGQPAGIIEATRIGPKANGTRTIRANTTSAGGNQWQGDQAGETFFCTVRLRVNWSARLDTNALAKGTLLSEPFTVPVGNDKSCTS